MSVEQKLKATVDNRHKQTWTEGCNNSKSARSLTATSRAAELGARKEAVCGGVDTAGGDGQMWGSLIWGVRAQPQGGVCWGRRGEEKRGESRVKDKEAA